MGWRRVVFVFVEAGGEYRDFWQCGVPVGAGEWVWGTTKGGDQTGALLGKGITPTDALRGLLVRTAVLISTT